MSEIPGVGEPGKKRASRESFIPEPGKIPGSGLNREKTENRQEALPLTFVANLSAAQGMETTALRWKASTSALRPQNGVGTSG